MTKKRVIKDDGRILIYYHAPQSATPQQTQVYAEIEAKEEAVNLGTNTANAVPEEKSHV